MSDADQRWQDALARARRQDVLAEVGRERSRQEQLKAKGKFTYTCADAEMPDGQRLAVLVEEVGEVARAMNDGKGLREELIQVAAVAVAWVEAIDTPESRFSGHTATLTPHRLPAGTVAAWEAMARDGTLGRWVKQEEESWRKALTARALRERGR